MSIRNRSYRVGDKQRSSLKSPFSDDTIISQFSCRHYLNSRGETEVRELRQAVADLMGLSADDREQMVPSGAQTTYGNRVAWALSYLKKAQLLSSPSRGLYKLTPAGKVALSEVGEHIDLKYLESFAKFREFRYGISDDEEGQSIELLTPNEEAEQTPEDVIQSAYKKINISLADELLGAIMEQTPAFFERLVVQLLMKMGYGGAFDDAGKVVGKTNDEGIDGIIREDKLGFSNIYIQAKRWDLETKIGRPEIQKFVGALAGQGANKGLFITTAQFSKEARNYAQNKAYGTALVLVDGNMLARLMIENEIGVSPIISYTIRRIDNDYFSDVRQ